MSFQPLDPDTLNPVLKHAILLPFSQNLQVFPDPRMTEPDFALLTFRITDRYSCAESFWTMVLSCLQLSKP